MPGDQTKINHWTPTRTKCIYNFYLFHFIIISSQYYSLRLSRVNGILNGEWRHSRAAMIAFVGYVSPPSPSWPFASQRGSIRQATAASSCEPKVKKKLISLNIPFIRQKVHKFSNVRSGCKRHRAHRAQRWLKYYGIYFSFVVFIVSLVENEIGAH